MSEYSKPLDVSTSVITLTINSPVVDSSQVNVYPTVESPVITPFSPYVIPIVGGSLTDCTSIYTSMSSVHEMPLHALNENESLPNQLDVKGVIETTPVVTSRLRPTLPVVGEVINSNDVILPNSCG